ncbi:MAG: hypothetical protein WD467_03720 [Candidatus Saccharimonadales bacterium]
MSETLYRVVELESGMSEVLYLGSLAEVTSGISSEDDLGEIAFERYDQDGDWIQVTDPRPTYVEILFAPYGATADADEPHDGSPIDPDLEPWELLNFDPFEGMEWEPPELDEPVEPRPQLVLLNGCLSCCGGAGICGEKCFNSCGEPTCKNLTASGEDCCPYHVRLFELIGEEILPDLRLVRLTG